MSFGQSLARVRYLAPAVKQGIADRLKDCHLAGFLMKIKRPRGCVSRLGRVVEAQTHAEVALLAVRVLLKDGPFFIGSQIHVGRFHRFTGKRRHCGSQLLMKEADYRIVVRDTTQWALAIAEMQLSGAELTPIVATQRCD